MSHELNADERLEAMSDEDLLKLVRETSRLMCNGARSGVGR